MGLYDFQRFIWKSYLVLEKSAYRTLIRTRAGTFFTSLVQINHTLLLYLFRCASSSSFEATTLVPSHGLEYVPVLAWVPLWLFSPLLWGSSRTVLRSQRLTASEKVILTINFTSGHRITNPSYIKSSICSVASALNMCCLFTGTLWKSHSAQSGRLLGSNATHALQKWGVQGWAHENTHLQPTKVSSVMNIKKNRVLVSHSLSWY